MLSETNYSMSELVYLFVDGESTPLQNDILFNALASNTDLQQELQEAILIRDTLVSDSVALAVPLKITTTIFQNAGVALPSNLVVGAAASFGEKIFLGFKSIALPLFTAVGGAFIALGFMNYFQSENNASNNTLAGTNLNKYTNNNPNTFSNNRNNKLTDNNFSNNKISNNKHNNITTANEIVAKKEDKIEERNITTSILKSNETQVYNKSIAISQSALAQNTSLLSQILFTKNNNLTSSPIGILPINNSEFITSYNEKLPLSFAVRGMMNLSSFPAGTKSTANEVPSNFTISIGYDLTAETKIGIEGGRQSIRYYTFENGKNEKATQRESIDWAGAYIRHNFNELTFFNLTPFANGTLGATVSGPTGRMITGFKWQPENSISLSAGVEASTFFYQKSSNWQNISALGFIYQVEINY